MGHRSGRHRFPLQPRMETRLDRLLRDEDLQCDVSIEAQVPRSVDLSHSSGTEQGKDFIRAESRA
jgi:hypothetical protein